MSEEDIKKEFLKSYNCKNIQQFKFRYLSNDKFEEIMNDYFLKCSYNQDLQQRIYNAIELINNIYFGNFFSDLKPIKLADSKEGKELLEILQKYKKEGMNNDVNNI